MGSDVSSHSLLGLAGLASLCCIGPGTAAIAGGTSVGMIAGVVRERWFSGCSAYRATDPTALELFVSGP